MHSNINNVSSPQRGKPSSITEFNGTDKTAPIHKFICNSTIKPITVSKLFQEK